MENERRNRDAAKTGAAEGESSVGDVESAGETTAAAVIGGSDNNSPVGAETMVKVADTPHPETSDDEES